LSSKNFYEKKTEIDMKPPNIYSQPKTFAKVQRADGIRPYGYWRILPLRKSTRTKMSVNRV
jgi:hypothetical protein